MFTPITIVDVDIIDKTFKELVSPFLKYFYHHLGEHVCCIFQSKWLHIPFKMSWLGDHSSLPYIFIHHLDLSKIWLQVQNREPWGFSKLCQYIFYQRHGKWIAPSLGIQRLVITTKPVASILIYWKCDSANIFRHVHVHISQLHKFLYLTIHINVFPKRQPFRSHLTRWKPLCIYGVFSKIANA